MKMRNWLKTTLALGMVVATGSVLVGCSGGSSMDFAKGVEAYSAQTADTGATKAAKDEAMKDAGYTFTFSANYNDAVTSTKGNIDATIIGSGKKAERVYEISLNVGASVGGKLVDISAGFNVNAANYAEGVVMYNSATKTKMTMGTENEGFKFPGFSPVLFEGEVTDEEPVIGTQDSGDENSTEGNGDFNIPDMSDPEAFFDALLGMMSIVAPFDVTEYADQAALDKANTDSAKDYDKTKEGNSKTILSSKFVENGTNSYTFTLSKEDYSTAKATTGTNIVEKIEKQEVVITIKDGKLSKVTNSMKTTKDGKLQNEMSTTGSLVYSAKSLTAPTQKQITEEYKEAGLMDAIGALMG